MRENISLVKGDNLGAGQGSFNHIAGGYDAGYYGYTYSLVFAADMYATVFKKDPLDPTRGQRYREKILLPGGSRDEIDSLKVRCSTLSRVPSINCDPVHRTSSAGSPTPKRSFRSCSASRRLACEREHSTSALAKGAGQAIAAHKGLSLSQPSQIVVIQMHSTTSPYRPMAPA